MVWYLFSCCFAQELIVDSMFLFLCYPLNSLNLLSLLHLRKRRGGEGGGKGEKREG